MSFGPYCYSNNGLSFRAVAQDYEPQAGEVVFETTPTSGQLAESFPGYAAAIAGVEAAAAATAALAGGITVTSTGTPDLDGTYSVDQESQSNVNATVTYILLNGTFPGGVDEMPWTDADGETHVFEDVATFKAFATAMANFVALTETYGDSLGSIGSIPSSDVTIM